MGLDLGPPSSDEGLRSIVAGLAVSTEGSVSVNVEPLPGPGLSAVSLPPCISASWREIVSPRPMPPCWRVMVTSAAKRLGEYQRDVRPGLLLTGDIETMTRLVEATGDVSTVNLGGIHHKPGRVQRLRYVFLSGQEEKALRALAASGVVVSAQDVPAGRPLSLDEVLSGEGNR